MNAGAIDLAIRASFVLAATWSVALVIKRGGSSAATWHAVWLSGFTALALLPVCARFLPHLPVPILPEVPAVAATGALPTLNGAPPSSGPLDTLGNPRVLYFVTSALLIARIVVGRIVLERLWRRAVPLTDGTPIEVARRVRASLHIRREIGLRVSDGALVPMTWGSLRPHILLPPAALGWSDDKWRSVLLHEFGHVLRNDSLTRLGVEAICALYWLHPMVWLTARRLRLAQEQACDDIALANGAPSIAYARDLLESARAFRRSHVALAMAGSADLEHRLRSILEEKSRLRASRRFSAAAAAVVLGAAPAVAVIAPAPAQSTKQTAPLRAAAPPIARLAQAAGAPAMLQTVGKPPRFQPTRAGQKSNPGIAQVLPDPTPNEDYELKLARYQEELGSYQSDLDRYGAQLNDYRAASDEFAQKVQAYRERMAEIGPNPGPGVTLPTYPTAPTVPTAPTMPAVPVRPAAPSH